MWSSMSGAEAIASLLSNPPLAQHLATYARMMAEPDALALLRTVQLGSAPLCALAQVQHHALLMIWPACLSLLELAAKPAPSA